MRLNKLWESGRKELGRAIFLTEMAMKMPSDIPSGYKVYIYVYEDHVRFEISNSNSESLGFISIQNFESYWYVKLVSAERGYGPLLYDLAMEYASKYGIGLIPGAAMILFGVIGESTSQTAELVWEYYFYNRDDVIKSDIAGFNNIVYIQNLNSESSNTIATTIKNKFSPTEIKRRYSGGEYDIIAFFSDEQSAEIARQFVAHDAIRSAPHLYSIYNKKIEKIQELQRLDLLIHNNKA